MMSSATLRLVLLISCAHALVHIYELSLPSVEQRIAEEYRPDQPQAGKQFTGRLSTTWRLPFGPWSAGSWLASRSIWRPQDAGPLSAGVRRHVRLGRVLAKTWPVVCHDV